MSNYNSELTSLAQHIETLTVEENLKLVPLVAAGDTDARQRMIEGNMALVVNKVDTYIHFFPQYEFLRDDLTSAGFIGLVNAVDRIAKVGDKMAAPVDYMRVAIIRELGELAETEGVIYIPRESQRTATAKGEPIIVGSVTGIDPDTCACPSEEAIYDMRELIQACCCCDEERTFVRMREQGYKLKEIAAAVDMPISSLHVMKEDLCRRVLARAGLENSKT